MNVVPIRRHDPVDDFVEYLYGAGLAPSTIRIYSRLFQRVVEWLAVERNTTLDAATAYDIVELARMIPQGRSSLSQLRATLGHYWEMTGRVRPPVKAIRLPRAGEPLPQALNAEEVAALVTTATGRHPDGTAALLGLYLALRVGEIVRTRWDRFDDNMAWYSVTNIKGGAVDRLPVHPALRGHLAGVEQVAEYVFPGHRGRAHVTEAAVWNWCRNLADEAGIGHLHSHQLRHTALTTANDITGDLRAVSKFARHQRIETTMRYTRTTTSALERVMRSLDYTQPNRDDDM